MAGSLRQTEDKPITLGFVFQRAACGPAAAADYGVSFQAHVLK